MIESFNELKQKAQSQLLIHSKSTAKHRICSYLCQKMSKNIIAEE